VHRAHACGLFVHTQEAMSTQPPSDNLYISDLPSSVNDDELRVVFSQYGTVKHSRLTSSGGAALIRFATFDEAKWIVENLNGNIPQGLQSPISVKYANAPRQDGGWQGGGWKGGGKGFDACGKGGFGMWDNYGGLNALAYTLSAKGFGKGKGYGKGGAVWMPGPKDAKGLVRDLCSGGQLPGGRKWENDENTIFVGGLPEDMSDLEMYVIFAPFGAIAPRGASARCDKETGKCTGIGFVNFLETAAAANAIRTLNGTMMSDGSMLMVKKKGPAKPKGEGKGLTKGDDLRETL